MSQYELPHLIKRWAQEAVTPEQVIGQILLHLNDLLERVKKLEQGAQKSQATGAESTAE